jgi:mannose-1-phosphate guanylyltransferase
MKEASDHPTRYGVVLAAGEGMRLRPLVRRLRGDALPKQYVSFLGRRSMLEHTFDRLERLIVRPAEVFARSFRNSHAG